jgi:hypothetical protein
MTVLRGAGTGRGCRYALATSATLSCGPTPRCTSDEPRRSIPAAYTCRSALALTLNGSIGRQSASGMQYASSVYTKPADTDDHTHTHIVAVSPHTAPPAVYQQPVRRLGLHLLRIYAVPLRGGVSLRRRATEARTRTSLLLFAYLHHKACKI